VGVNEMELKPVHIRGIERDYTVPLNQFRIFGIFIPSKNSV
jgi:hypothetical protein